MRKQAIWVGMFAGSFIGGYVPALWSADLFSLSSVICTALGGFLGIWLALKLTA